MGLGLAGVLVWGLWHGAVGAPLEQEARPNVEPDERARVVQRPERRRTPGVVELAAVTDFPLSVGGRAAVELPGRLRLSTGLGVLPPVYLRVINETLVAFDVLEEDVASLVQVALDSALVWRSGLGWRPSSGSGFFVEAGYSLVTLGGGLTGAELLWTVTGLNLPRGGGQLGQVSAGSTLHQANAGIGWHWNIGRRLSLRMGLSGFYTLGASTRITTEGLLAAAPFEALVDAAEAELTSIYTRHVHGGTVSLSVGYWLW